jgi:twitching motility protein PilT
MLRHINETRHAHIVTIEDPIEFLHEPPQVHDHPA